MNKLTKWTPKTIKEELEKYVVGQKDAVTAYSLLIYNTLLRKELAKQGVNVNLNKSILLVAGDTGTGKTFLAQKAEELFGINVVLIDGSRVNGHGWSGTRIEDYLLKLETKILKKLQLSDRVHFSDEETSKVVITELHNTIIFIDEFDKLFVSHDTHNRDSTQAAQASLLKFLEGDIYAGKKLNFDTSIFNFILSGVFEEVLDNDSKKQSIGFTEQQNDDITQTMKEKLRKMGVGREILGRVTRATMTNKLSKHDLEAILERKDSPISHYKNVFILNDSLLTISPNVIATIAELALTSNLGARALKEEVDNLFEPLLMEVDTYSGLWINAYDVVEKKLVIRCGDGIYSELSHYDEIDETVGVDPLKLLRGH